MNFADVLVGATLVGIGWLGHIAWERWEDHQLRYGPEFVALRAVHDISTEAIPRPDPARDRLLNVIRGPYDWSAGGDL